MKPQLDHYCEPTAPTVRICPELDETPDCGFLPSAPHELVPVRIPWARIVALIIAIDLAIRLVFR